MPKEVVRKIQIKFKILDLVVKENERIIPRNKVNELIKQQKVFKKRLDEINDLKVAAVQMREEFHMREQAKADNVNCKVKLPKLFITKFNGTHLDWFRF